MDWVKSLIQRAQPLARLRRRFRGPRRRLETTQEETPTEDTAAEEPTSKETFSTTREEITEAIEEDIPLASCHCKNIILCSQLSDYKDYWIYRAEDVATALKTLVAKPSPRIEQWLWSELVKCIPVSEATALPNKPEFEFTVTVPQSMILFDVTALEIRQREEAGFERCKFCSNFGGFEERDHGDCFLAACCDEKDGWQFGVASLKVESRTIRTAWITFRFELIGFEKQKFFSLAASNITSREVLARPMNASPGSDKSHALAQNWLKTCLGSHNRCPKSTGDFMPTRLLEIEHFQDHMYPRLRLRETYGRDFALYAALSYCWGGEQHVKTTSENLYQNLIRLNYTELPATIRDAIIITSKMALRYLWIDSLCILQNDSRDKNYEISQMPSIYSQATITISASRAASVEEGFLHDRSPLENNSRFPRLKFPYLPYRGENAETTSIILVPEVEEEPAQPLDNRGWALQERLLSSRVIEYGSVQTRWVCMHEDRTQTDGLKQGAENGSGKSDMVFRKALDVIRRGGTTFGGPQIADGAGIFGLESWKDILKRYTKRTLTLPTDRLPAISGVAMRFSRILGDEYCAGLWKSTLAMELLWAVVDDEKLVSRPVEYQGPSWSWAAINAPITSILQEPTDSIDAHFAVVGVNIQPVKSRLDNYDAKFGAVESGRLVLKGKLKAAFWVRPQNSPTNSSRWNVLRGANYRDSNPDLTFINIHPDAEEIDKASTDHIPVFLLKILERKRESDLVFQSRPPMGLILRQNGESEYTRLGVFEFVLNRDYSGHGVKGGFGLYQKQVAWLNDCETQTVTIV